MAELQKEFEDGGFIDGGAAFDDVLAEAQQNFDNSGLPRVDFSVSSGTYDPQARFRPADADESLSISQYIKARSGPIGSLGDDSRVESAPRIGMNSLLETTANGSKPDTTQNSTASTLRPSRETFSLGCGSGYSQIHGGSALSAVPPQVEEAAGTYTVLTAPLPLSPAAAPDETLETTLTRSPALSGLRHSMADGLRRKIVDVLNRTEEARLQLMGRDSAAVTQPEADDRPDGTGQQEQHTAHTGSGGETAAAAGMHGAFAGKASRASRHRPSQNTSLNAHSGTDDFWQSVRGDGTAADAYRAWKPEGVGHEAGACCTTEGTSVGCQGHARDCWNGANSDCNIDHSREHQYHVGNDAEGDAGWDHHHCHHSPEQSVESAQALAKEKTDILKRQQKEDMMHHKQVQMSRIQEARAEQARVRNQWEMERDLKEKAEQQKREKQKLREAQRKREADSRCASEADDKSKSFTKLEQKAPKSKATPAAKPRESLPKNINAEPQLQPSLPIPAAKGGSDGAASPRPPLDVEEVATELAAQVAPPATSGPAGQQTQTVVNNVLHELSVGGVGVASPSVQEVVEEVMRQVRGGNDRQNESVRSVDAADITGMLEDLRSENEAIRKMLETQAAASVPMPPAPATRQAHDKHLSQMMEAVSRLHQGVPSRPRGGGDRPRSAQSDSTGSRKTPLQRTASVPVKRAAAAGKPRAETGRTASVRARARNGAAPPPTRRGDGSKTTGDGGSPSRRRPASAGLAVQGRRVVPRMGPRRPGDELLSATEDSDRTPLTPKRPVSSGSPGHRKPRPPPRNSLRRGGHGSMAPTASSCPDSGSSDGSGRTYSIESVRAPGSLPAADLTDQTDCSVPGGRAATGEEAASRSTVADRLEAALPTLAGAAAAAEVAAVDYESPEFLVALAARRYPSSTPSLGRDSALPTDLQQVSPIGADPAETVSSVAVLVAPPSHWTSDEGPLLASASADVQPRAIATTSTGTVSTEGAAPAPAVSAQHQLTSVSARHQPVSAVAQHQPVAPVRAVLSSGVTTHRTEIVVQPAVNAVMSAAGVAAAVDVDAESRLSRPRVKGCPSADAAATRRPRRSRIPTPVRRSGAPGDTHSAPSLLQRSKSVPLTAAPAQVARSEPVAAGDRCSLQPQDAWTQSATEARTLDTGAQTSGLIPAAASTAMVERHLATGAPHVSAQLPEKTAAQPAERTVSAAAQTESSVSASAQTQFSATDCVSPRRASRTSAPGSREAAGERAGPPVVALPTHVDHVEVLCTDIPTEISFTARNLTENWLQLVPTVTGVEVNGVRCDDAEMTNAVAVSLRTRTLLETHQEAELRVGITPRVPGALSVTLQLRATYIEHSKWGCSQLSVVTVRLLAERPAVELLSPDPSLVHFGTLPEDCRKLVPLTLVNLSRAAVPVTLLVRSQGRAFHLPDTESNEASAAPQRLTSTLAQLTLLAADASREGISPVTLNVALMTPYIDSDSDCPPLQTIEGVLEVRLDGAAEPAVEPLLCCRLQATVGRVKLRTRCREPLELRCRPSETTSVNLPMKNTGNIPLEVQLTVKGLRDAVWVRPDRVTVPPRAERDVMLTFQPLDSFSGGDGLLVLTVQPDGLSFEVDIRGVIGECRQPERTRAVSPEMKSARRHRRPKKARDPASRSRSPRPALSPEGRPARDTAVQTSLLTLAPEAVPATTPPRSRRPTQQPPAAASPRVRRPAAAPARSAPGKRPPRASDVLGSNKQVLVWTGVRLGRPASESLVLRNNSDSPLDMWLKIRDGAEFTFRQPGETPAGGGGSLELTIPAQSDRELTLVYQPTRLQTAHAQLVIKPAIQPADAKYIKFTIPLIGYSGSSEVQLNVTAADGLRLGEVQPGTTVHTPLTVANVGDRAAFVAIQAYRDADCLHPLSAAEFSARPAQLVLSAGEGRQVALLLRVTAGQPAPACLRLLAGDELLRHAFKLLPQDRVVSSRHATPSVMAVGFSAQFEGEVAADAAEMTIFKRLNKIADVFFANLRETRLPIKVTLRSMDSTLFTNLHADDTVASVLNCTAFSTTRELRPAAAQARPAAVPAPSPARPSADTPATRASRGSGTVPRTPPAAPAAAAGRRHRSDVSLESGPDGGQSPSPPPPPPGDGPPPPPPEGAAQLQLGSDQVQFPVTAVGRRSSGSLRFSNSSGVDLHWSLEPLVKPWVQSTPSGELTGAGGDVFRFHPTQGDVKPSQTVELAARFTPPAAGLFTQTFYLVTCADTGMMGSEHAALPSCLLVRVGGQAVESGEPAPPPFPLTVEPDTIEFADQGAVKLTINNKTRADHAFELQISGPFVVNHSQMLSRARRYIHLPVYFRPPGPGLYSGRLTLRLLQPAGDAALFHVSLVGEVP